MRGTDRLPAAVAPWPSTLSELTGGEALVAWGLRRWLRGLSETAPVHWEIVWNDFACRFGTGDGRLAVSALAALARALSGQGRRGLRCHPPCCAFVSADEACLIGLVAACQRGEPALARLLAERLVRAAGIEEMLAAGAQLAAVFGRHALGLPRRARGVDAVPASVRRPPQAVSAKQSL